jgi:hypothetical protein
MHDFRLPPRLAWDLCSFGILRSVGCPETLIRNYLSTLCNIPKHRVSQNNICFNRKIRRYFDTKYLLDMDIFKIYTWTVCPCRWIYHSHTKRRELLDQRRVACEKTFKKSSFAQLICLMILFRNLIVVLFGTFMRLQNVPHVTEGIFN